MSLGLFTCHETQTASQRSPIAYRVDRGNKSSTVSDPVMADFLGGIMDQIWARQKRSLADEKPGVISQAFNEL